MLAPLNPLGLQAIRFLNSMNTAVLSRPYRSKTWDAGREFLRFPENQDEAVILAGTNCQSHIYRLASDLWFLEVRR